AALAVLLAARGAEAFDRLPTLGRAIEVLHVTTCRLTPDDAGDASKPLSTDGSSILDVEQPQPALALPRSRSGANGKPGAEDGLGGMGALVAIPPPPARCFDPEALADTLPRRVLAPPSQGAQTPRLARGPPAARC